MQQPELGRRLTALRKEKKLTQEELVEKSHVSVRTIQRIEAGEVLPRMSTVKILLEALGESYETFLAKQQAVETQQNKFQEGTRNKLLTAALAGVVYIVSEIILGAMDLSRITHNWETSLNAIYICLTVLMVASFALFARGFIVLSDIFENTILKATSWLLLTGVIGMGILDITLLSVHDTDRLLLPYAATAVLMGALSLAFGISLLRLQDGMGILARIAGILEIMVGCTLLTVVLFFITYVILVPAVVVEIVLLYRGYEYLSRTEPVRDTGS